MSIEQTDLAIAKLVARNQHLEVQNKQLRKGAPVLSKREEQIYRMIAGGLACSEIAEKIFLSVKTVSTYRHRILKKLRLANNVDITFHAIRNRVITVEILPVEECVAI